MSTVWAISSEVAWTDEGGRVAVLDLDRLEQPPVVFTGSGGDIWRALDGERNEDAIVSILAAEYEVNDAEIGSQVRTVLTDLAQRQLLVRR